MDLDIPALVNFQKRMRQQQSNKEARLARKEKGALRRARKRAANLPVFSIPETENSRLSRRRQEK